MKKLFLITCALCTLIGVSCTTTGPVSGSLPIPFTDPPSRLKGEIAVQPVPPKFSVGLDIIPEG